MENDNQPVWPNRKLALSLMMSINLLCYADRYVLSAVVPAIRPLLQDPSQYSWPVQWLVVFFHWLTGGRVEDAMIGALPFAFMVTYMIMSMVFAALPLKRWHIIGLGVILWSLASGGSGMVSSFGSLLVMRCLVGVGEAAYGPIAPTVIADMYSPKARARSQSFFQLTTPAGSALGFTVGGLMMASQALGWRWAFYSAVPPGLILGFACFFMKDYAAAKLSSQGKPSAKQRMKDFFACLGNRTYVYNVLAGAAMTFAIGGIAFWMPSYIVEYRHLGNAGLVNTVFGVILTVGGIGGTYLGGIVADRQNSKDRGAYMKVSAKAMLATLLFTVLMLMTTGIPEDWAFLAQAMFWAFLALAVFFLFFNTGPANAVITNVTAPALRPAAFALYIFAIHILGDVISPFVIGAVSDATGGNMNIAFMVVAGTVAVSAVLFWLGARHLGDDSKYANS